MKFLKIKSCIIKKYKPSSRKRKVNTEGKENLLNQEFKTNTLRSKMVSDIRYIYVKNYGWTYLATVEDLCSRLIIGYSYGKTIDEELVMQAIKNAEVKGKFKKNAIFHSDLGSQYTSSKVEKYLKELGLKHSYSKKGYPYFMFIESWYNRKRIHSSIGYKTSYDIEKNSA